MRQQFLAITLLAWSVSSHGLSRAGDFDAKSLLSVTRLDGQEINLRVVTATLPVERQRGPMNRKELEDDHGMLFVFDSQRSVSMWMKNTTIALDILFIDEDGTVSKIVANTAPLSSQIPSTARVQAVLEINAGRSRELGIEVGAVIHHELLAK